MTMSSRDLDHLVLAALAAHSRSPSYFIRNVIARQKSIPRSALGTARVLRACRRLERLGQVVEVPSSYAVMLCWDITDAGRATLAEAAP